MDHALRQVLYIRNCLILITTLRNEYNYTNSTNKEIKAQTAKITCPNTTGKWQRWDLTAEHSFLTRRGRKRKKEGPSDVVTPKLCILKDLKGANHTCWFCLSVCLEGGGNFQTELTTGKIDG